MTTQVRRSCSIVLAAWIITDAGLIARSAVAAEPAIPAGTTIHRSQVTGMASFIKPSPGDTIAMPQVVGAAVADLRDVFETPQGRLFGVTDPRNQMVVQKVDVDGLGFTHTTFKQVHKGVPVFSGVVKVHQNATGGVVALNGDFYTIPTKLKLIPTLDSDAAAAVARKRVGDFGLAVESAELVIVDPGWYGDPPKGARLTYYLVLANQSETIREAFFVDAHSGEALDQWTLIETARDREVYDSMEVPDSAGTLVRVEGDPPTGDADEDAGYDYAGDTYDYFFRAFGRDSTDDAGRTMKVRTHYVSSGSPCPNAFGGGGVASFCTGTASDDVVAHEFQHSVTGYSAGLIYQNQAGQLNESMSDIFGELVDLFNGDASLPGAQGGTPWPTHDTGPGTDTPNNQRSECSVLAPAHLQVNSPMDIAGQYWATPASFGNSLTPTGISGLLVAVDPVQACDFELPFTNPPGAFVNKIALVDRGTCAFTEKVLNLQDEGAIAVIVVNNVTGYAISMPGVDPAITIPSVMISINDGARLRTALQGGPVDVTLTDATEGIADGYRWVVSEDATAFGRPLRDMWDPQCLNHPNRAYSPLQICEASDNGGVHRGSGVLNHAFAMMTDGKNFNGYSVAGMGPIKSGAVIYRALTTYFTPATDFQEAYYFINAAAADLVGTTPNDPRTGTPSPSIFSYANANEVNEALLAVEMNGPGACGAVQDILNQNPPTECYPRTSLYADGFESGVNGWTVSNTGPSGPPTPYDWAQVSGLPFGRTGTAWYCEDRNIGDCAGQDESAVHSLMSPMMDVPPVATAPVILRFTHYLASECGYDGGNVSISVNSGPWQLLGPERFTYNAYSSTLNSAPGNTNPLAGQEAWTCAGGQWGTSLVDISSLIPPASSHVRFRFDFGKDGCAGIDGWYLDDLELYECRSCVTSADCSDSLHCNGSEICISNICQPDSPVPNCCEVDAECVNGLNCDGIETCTAHVCQSPTPENCCFSTTECVDADPCTFDVCVQSCYNLPTGCTTDTTPPTIVDVTVLTPTVDISSGNAGASLRVHMADTQSGVGQWIATFASPYPGQLVQIGGVAAWTLVSGTPQDGVFESTVTIPQYSAGGTWSANGMSAGDNLGNHEVYTDPIEFEVISPEQDVSPPTIHSVTVTPSVVDVSGGPAAVTMSVHLSDTQSGVGQWIATFASPYPGQLVQIGGVTSWTLVSGTPQDGVFESTVTIPQYSAGGTWSANGMSAGDNLGNHEVYTDPIEFEVISPEQDVSPPTIHSVTVTPSVVDVSGGPAAVTMSVHLSDTQSGVGQWIATFASPFPGQLTQIGGVTSGTLVSGTPLDGVFESSVLVPQGSAQGTWRANGMSTGDALGNSSFYPSEACNLYFCVEFCTPDCDANNVPDDCDIEAGTHLDCNENGIPDACETGCTSASDNDVDDGETAELHPAGESDPTVQPQVVFTNNSGTNDASVTLNATSDPLHSAAGGFQTLGNYAVVDTSLANGQFALKVTTQFDASDLGGGNPLAVDLVWYDPNSDSWVLAASGNTQNSPGYPGPIGDRFPLSSPDTTPVLADLSNELGDYGVFWNEMEMRGFAWANVDHASVYAVGVSPTVPCLLDSECRDTNICTHDRCLPGGCANTIVGFGNVNGAGPINQANLDDILCVLSGFAGFVNCPNGDIAPTTGPLACQGDNNINLDDILAVLGAFAGGNPCGCTP